MKTKKVKHLKVTFVGDITKYYPCHNFIILHSQKFLFIYDTAEATVPSEQLNYSNILGFKSVMLCVPENPLDENYDNPLN